MDGGIGVQRSGDREEAGEGDSTRETEKSGEHSAETTRVLANTGI